jgi:vacuolar-type H+-ATPase subunit D/Vma8
MATDKPELKIQFLQQSLTDVGKAFLKERKAKEELQKTIENLRHEIEQTKIEADALMMKKIKYYEDKIAKIQEGLDPTDRARKAGL